LKQIKVTESISKTKMSTPSTKSLLPLGDAKLRPEGSAVDQKADIPQEKAPE
jgi:hypothetical protein